MTNIGLFINHKNGKVLRAKKSFMPDEMIARRENYYLSDYFIRNDKGGVNIFYQFHTKKYIQHFNSLWFLILSVLSVIQH
ncbi:hypothetical protein F1C14_13165 [Clostridium perfringens]|nr:hypothetical protein F1C14_13165 [Clostridium perfringens]